MFSQQVYSSNSQRRALSDLLDNMLVIRGFASGIDGHPFNAVVQQAPLGGVSTLSGLAAESSVSTFDAVQWPGRGA